MVDKNNSTLRLRNENGTALCPACGNKMHILLESKCELVYEQTTGGEVDRGSGAVSESIGDETEKSFICKGCHLSFEFETLEEIDDVESAKQHYYDGNGRAFCGNCDTPLYIDEQIQTCNRYNQTTDGSKDDNCVINVIEADTLLSSEYFCTECGYQYPKGVVTNE